MYPTLYITQFPYRSLTTPHVSHVIMHIPRLHLFRSQSIAHTHQRHPDEGKQHTEIPVVVQT